MPGFRVVPMMHLSTDDVWVFLERQVLAHGPDGPLVLRLEIDA